MSTKSTIFISGVEFSGGQKIDVLPDDKIIIVGSNNSGKSQTLRDIYDISNNGSNEKSICVTDVDIHKLTEREFLTTFLRKNSKKIGNSYISGSWSIPEMQVPLWNSSHLRGNIINIFFKNIDAENRLQICKQARSKTKEEIKDNPQQIMYDDRKLTENLSKLFRLAFNKGLLIDYRGGSVIPIHVGDEPDWKVIDRVSDEYVDYVRSNPRLDLQGDGIKSYAGILLESIVSDYSMIMIDEPEAFLHPPQMRRLGQTLATEVKGQLFVATHSSDILRGFLEGAKGNVRIIRIRREGDINMISEPPKEAISELWEKPSLRYSNALGSVLN